LFSSPDRSPRVLPPSPTRRSSDFFLDGNANRRFAAQPGAGDERVANVLGKTVAGRKDGGNASLGVGCVRFRAPPLGKHGDGPMRSEEHTSELQSHLNIVCRLLLAT